MTFDGTINGDLVVERDEAVTILTLNRPHRLNALLHENVKELRERLLELDADPAIRAIILTGEGRAFSAGADLQATTAPGTDVLRTYYNPLIQAMAGMGTPIIAAVNGLAAGAAVSIALACDLRVVDENATFQTPFVNVGLVPDAGATWALPRMIGMAKASAMMLLGQPLTASEALAAGLINEVCTSGEVLERAMEMARAIANASSTVGATRKLVQGGLGRSLDEQLEAEATAQLLAQNAPDFAEAKLAFAEKRKPRFR